MKPETLYSEFSNIAISSDDKTLVSTRNDVVKIWEFPTGKLLKEVKIEGSLYALAIHPSSKTFAILGSTIQIRQMDEGTLVRKLPANHDREKSLAFSPDGKILANLYKTYIDMSSTLNFWEFDTGKLLQSWKNVGANTIAISPDNRLLATNVDQAIKIWRMP